MPPVSEFYEQPSAEALAAAGQWAKAEIVQENYEFNSPYNYGCRIVTDQGQTVEGWINLSPDHRGLGEITIPYGVVEPGKKGLGSFQKRQVTMAINNQPVFQGINQTEPLAARLGIKTENTGFKLGRSSNETYCLKIKRNLFAINLQPEEQWRYKRGGLIREELHLSVAGLAQVFEQSFPGVKLKPMAVELK